MLAAATARGAALGIVALAVAGRLNMVVVLVIVLDVVIVVAEVVVVVVVVVVVGRVGGGVQVGLGLVPDVGIYFGLDVLLVS